MSSRNVILPADDFRRGDYLALEESGEFQQTIWKTLEYLEMNGTVMGTKYDEMKGKRNAIKAKRPKP